MPDDPGVIPQSMMEALELSYEQFLSTFTHLSTEKVTADCPMVPEEENKTCLVKLNKRDGVNMDRKTDAEVATEGLRNTEDVRVLPGEVEEDLPAYTPAYCHRTQLELSSTDMGHWTHTPPSNTESQSETEDAVPFSLDDTFDYDNVALSHKYPVKSSTGGSS